MQQPFTLVRESRKIQMDNEENSEENEAPKRVSRSGSVIPPHLFFNTRNGWTMVLVTEKTAKNFKDLHKRFSKDTLYGYLLFNIPVILTYNEDVLQDLNFYDTNVFVQLDNTYKYPITVEHNIDKWIKCFEYHQITTDLVADTLYEDIDSFSIVNKTFKFSRRLLPCEWQAYRVMYFLVHGSDPQVPFT